MTATIKMKAGSRKWNPRPTELFATLREQKARHKHGEERARLVIEDLPCRRSLYSWRNGQPKKGSTFSPRDPHIAVIYSLPYRVSAYTPGKWPAIFTKGFPYF